MDFDTYECRLCGERFDTPAELAEHEQAEEDREYPIDGL
jgi:hypothetical protein